MNEEEVGSNPVDSRRLLLWFIGIVLFLYFGRNIGTWTVGLNFAIVFGFLFLVSSTQLAFWISRYYMFWFICDGAQGSVSHDYPPLVVPDTYRTTKEGLVKFNWLVYGLGAYRFPLPLRGKLETVIVIDCQTDRTRNNFNSQTRVDPVTYAELGAFPILQNALWKHRENYNLKNIKIGSHMTDYEYEELGDIDKDFQLERQGEVISMLRDQLNNKLDSVESFKAVADVFSDGKKKGLFGGVKDFIAGKDKEED